MIVTHGGTVSTVFQIAPHRRFTKIDTPVYSLAKSDMEIEPTSGVAISTGCTSSRVIASTA